MEDKKNFGFGTQIRKSPYFNSTVKWGATGFSVYNHMYIPRDFGLIKLKLMTRRLVKF